MVRSCTSIKIGLFILVILQYACDGQSFKYDKKFNYVRKDIGLPLLNDNWKLYKKGIDFRQCNFLIYVNPKVNNGWDRKSPIHYTKDIKYNNDTIISETDTYFSGKTFETIDATINISLVVKYNFIEEVEENETSNKGWSYILFYAPENNTYGKKLTKEQADSVFVNWGLN